MRTLLLRGARSAAVIGLAASAAAVDTTPTWQTPEPVANVPNYFLDFAEYEGQSRYLAFDHYGLPGIAFADQTSPTSTPIFYARRVPGIGWFADAVAIVGSFPEFVAQPCLAYDLSETPSISVMSRPNDTDDPTAWFGRADEDDFWSTQQVGVICLGNNTPDRLASSLAYDLLGRANVLSVEEGCFGDPYVQSSADANANGDLTDDPQFLVMQLEPHSYDDITLSLDVDHLARPMGAIGIVDPVDASPNQVYFGFKDIGQGWAAVLLDANARHPSLAIDPDTGYPAIAWYDTAGQNLVYTEWDGNQWVATNVDTAGSTGLWPSLAFDPTDGNPAIAYYDQTGGDLNFAWHDGVQWNTQTVVDGTFEVPTGYTPSLAFNDFGTGFPAIAYFGVDSNIYFVEDPPKLGDLDGDGHVGIADFLILIGSWGQAKSPADLNHDGVVGIIDFLMLLENWG